MKKLILFSAVVAMFLILIVLIFNREEKDSKEIDIPTYKTDVICKSNSYDEESDIETFSNIYLNYDEEKYVTDVIFQSITMTQFTDSQVELLESYFVFYEGIDGINTDIEVIDNYIISTIKYNFLEIDEKQVQKELGDILSEEALLMQDFPLSYDDYVDLYLNDYECVLNT